MVDILEKTWKEERRKQIVIIWPSDTKHQCVWPDDEIISRNLAFAGEGGQVYQTRKTSGQQNGKSQNTNHNGKSRLGRKTKWRWFGEIEVLPIFFPSSSSTFHKKKNLKSDYQHDQSQPLTITRWLTSPNNNIIISSSSNSSKDSLNNLYKFAAKKIKTNLSNSSLTVCLPVCVGLSLCVLLITVCSTAYTSTHTHNSCVWKENEQILWKQMAESISGWENSFWRGQFDVRERRTSPTLAR